MEDSIWKNLWTPYKAEPAKILTEVLPNQKDATPIRNQEPTPNLFNNKGT